MSATYVGSPEHKIDAWWGGLPQAHPGKNGAASRPKKQVTTICPLTSEADRDKATTWVQGALVAGQFRYYEGDKDFPKHIWYQEEGHIWFGYCVNGVLGQYKGWPIEDEERIAVFGRLGR